MTRIAEQFKQLLVTAAFLLCFIAVDAQRKPAPVSKQFKVFTHLCNEANVVFTDPSGFREIRAVNNENFSYDYAVELPGSDFEIWFQVRSQKENFNTYLKVKNSDKQIANPDSLYLEAGRAQATAFTGDQSFTVKSLSPEVLTRYHADAGKAYALTLLDMPETKGYKYALLVTLQKDHTGTIMAICFTNERNAEFFKKMKRAADCVKFKS